MQLEININNVIWNYLFLESPLIIITTFAICNGDSFHENKIYEIIEALSNVPIIKKIKRKSNKWDRVTWV